MTLGHRQALVELERVRASRDSLQVALDDMRRQMRGEVLDLRGRQGSVDVSHQRRTVQSVPEWNPDTG